MIWYRIFPQYKLVRTATGIWNINVSTDLFGDYNETKYARYYLKYSKRLNRYKVSYDGYKPKDHGLYSVYINEAARLNNEIEK